METDSARLTDACLRAVPVAVAAAAGENKLGAAAEADAKLLQNTAERRSSMAANNSRAEKKRFRKEHEQQKELLAGASTLARSPETSFPLFLLKRWMGTDCVKRRKIH